MKSITFLAILFAALSPQVQAQIIAEDLLVNIDATLHPTNEVLNVITNRGSMGGFFEATGGTNLAPTTVRFGDTGTRAIRFNALAYMEHVDAPGGSVVLAPAGIVGSNRTSTIEAWVYNRHVPGEETIVSWAHRGGPGGSNMSFNYGSSPAFGAVGHWGGADIGWGPVGFPPVREWHLLTYTFDSTTTRVYIDGVLANSETLASGAINTHTNMPVLLAAQRDANTNVTAGLRGSLDIARLRIHDGVLTDADVLANYNSEKDEMTLGSPEAFTQPIHRYSFSNANGPAEGIVVQDLVGDADGVVLGSGAQFINGQLALPGGPSDSAAYVDLPNGLLSTNSVDNGGSGAITFEGWYTMRGVHVWERLFDFGRANVGEITGPGTGSGGVDHFYFARLGTSATQKRLEILDNVPSVHPVTRTEFLSYSDDNVPYHFAVSWDEASGAVRIYEYGQEIAQVTTTNRFSDIEDLNNWLGRSQYSVNDNLSADLDEFRIYDYVLTPGQVLGSMEEGPDVLFSDPGALLGIRIGTIETNLVLEQGVQLPMLGDFENIANVNINASNIVYSSSNPSVLSVTTNGQVRALREGMATITATFGGFTDTVDFTSTRPEPLTLVHRYPFTDSAADVIGGAHGVLSNNTGNAVYTNGTLVMGNTIPANSNTLTGDFVELPDGMISALHSNATFEVWTTWQGPTGSNWQRIFDFGISDGGDGVSSVGANSKYFFLTPRGGPGVTRFGYRHTDPTVVERVVDDATILPSATEQHLVITWNQSLGLVSMFINGQFIMSNQLHMSLADLDDLNNWLGRSQWPDPYYNGSYNEFRIYSGAMTDLEVQDSFAAGPDSIETGSDPVLTIQRMPDGRVRMAWPVTATGYTLQGADDAGGPFTNSTLPLVLEGAENVVYTTPTSEHAVFRLVK